MSELPLNWAPTTLGTLCDKGQYGWTTKATSKGLVKFLRTTDITKGPINWSSVPYCLEAPPDIDKYLVKANDILISRAGSVGFSVLIEAVPSPTVFASYLIRFVPSEKVSSRFVAYFLRSANYWHQIGEAAAGIALANVNATKLANLDAPLPPFNEQERIVDKLDSALARVDACRERLDRVPAILKRFRQAVLDAATSGRLTEEWRQTPNTDRWLELPLSQVAAVIDPNPSHRYPSYEKGTVPIIATEQFEGINGYDVSKAKLVNQSFYQERLSAHGFLPHDIVFARKGRLGLARRLPELQKFVFSHTIFLIRSHEPSHANYLLWYLRNDKCIEWLFQEMHSNQGVPTLGKSFMERLPIRVPPMAEQLEIVRRVEALFAYADRLETRYNAARNQVERLMPALLAKAFRGELVPQNPNDEPASVLLERIKAAREIAHTKPKQLEIGRGGKMSKATAESIKGIIRQLPDDHFTFDDLDQKKVSGAIS